MPFCRASSDERQIPLPGDHIAVPVRVQTTQAVTILAPPEAVWPWLVQMGQDRAGFYSYSLLENLVGCNIRNANHVHPEWQNLETGDTIALHPKALPLTVAELKPNEHVVLTQNRPIRWSWTFFLQGRADNHTRLLIRTRATWTGRLAGLIMVPGMHIGHRVMERKMMLGIRSRCEANVAPPSSRV